jgi:MFS transporter, DHA2 family, methylenomycin A resistance protein
MASGLALALGPPIGGILVSGPGWRWIFLANAPLAVALVLLAKRFVPRLPSSPGQGRLDWPGGVLVTCGLAALAFATIEGQARGWAAGVVLAAFAAGALALAGFIVTERRRPEPLIDLSLFGRASFTAASAAAFIVFFTFVGGIVYFSAYFQEVQGRSAVGAGLDVAPIGISYALAATWSGRLVGRAGERWPLLAGLVMAGAAMLGLLRLEPGTQVSSIWWNFALLGAGVGLCGTPMSTIAMSAVAASRAGLASAIVNTMRQVGQVFGIAVLGALVYARLPAGSTGGRLGPEQGSEFVAGLHHALWLSGIALLAAAGLVAALRAGDRRVSEPPIAESVDCGYHRLAD